ncbi:hypothetical protein EDC04DRAFT_2496979, partial [Pisolithus marmoratus]
CGWVTPSGEICRALVPREQFRVHLNEIHGIHGNDKARFRCQWVNCGMEMNKESMMRHVEEAHLYYTYPCVHCGEVFSRRGTLYRHVRRRHGGEPCIF